MGLYFRIRSCGFTEMVGHGFFFVLGRSGAVQWTVGCGADSPSVSLCEPPPSRGRLFLGDAIIL